MVYLISNSEEYNKKKQICEKCNKDDKIFARLCVNNSNIDYFCYCQIK